MGYLSRRIINVYEEILPSFSTCLNAIAFSFEETDREKFLFGTAAYVLAILFPDFPYYHVLGRNHLPCNLLIKFRTLDRRYREGNEGRTEDVSVDA